LRSVFGFGIRDKVYSSDKVKVFLGSSIFYEYEEIQPNNEFNSDFRWSNYISWFMNFKHFSFAGTSYYQVKLGDFKDYRFAGQYSFETQLSKKLRLKSELNLFYDSKPPETVRSTISSFLFGFSYQY
jgi:hypothetical protein